MTKVGLVHPNRGELRQSSQVVSGNSCNKPTEYILLSLPHDGETEVNMIQCPSRLGEAGDQDLNSSLTLQSCWLQFPFPRAILISIFKFPQIKERLYQRLLGLVTEESSVNLEGSFGSLFQMR